MTSDTDLDFNVLCALCGDTGLIPPFMDPCTCGAVVAEANTWAAPGAPAAAWDEAIFQATIPGTTIATPGFPPGAVHGQVITSSDDGFVYVFDATRNVWVKVLTEALTAAEYMEKYGDPDDFTMPTATIEYGDAGEIDLDAIEAEAEAAAAAAAREADNEDTAWREADDIDAVIDAVAHSTLAEMDTAEAVAAIDDDTTLAGIFAEMDAEWGTWAATAEATVEETPVVTDTASYKVASGKPITLAQTTLLARLVAERDPKYTIVTQAQTELASSPLTAKRASRLIDALMKVPADPARKAPKPNKYAGSCGKCKGNVPAGDGRVEKNETTGRWVTYHMSAADCITPEAAKAAEADRVDEPGLYRHEAADGTTFIYRVRPGRTSKRLYGERVITASHTHDGITHTSVTFVYNANAMNFLSKASKLTWQEARDFGAAYGACVACGRTLSDPRSLVQNYGPTCAGHYGWPTVTVKQAEAIIAGVLTWEDVVGSPFVGS